MKTRFGRVWWVHFEGHEFIKDEPYNVFFSANKLCVNMFVRVIDNDNVWNEELRGTLDFAHLMDLCVQFVLDYDVDTPLPKLHSMHIEFYKKLKPWLEEDFCAEESEKLKKHILENISLEEVCEYARNMLIQQTRCNERMEQVSYGVVDLYDLYKDENAYAMSPFQQKLFLKLIREKMRQENGQYDHRHGKLYLDDKVHAQKVKETARKMLRFIKENF